MKDYGDTMPANVMRYKGILSDMRRYDDAGFVTLNQRVEGSSPSSPPNLFKDLEVYSSKPLLFRVTTEITKTSGKYALWQCQINRAELAAQ